MLSFFTANKIALFQTLVSFWLEKTDCFEWWM